MVFEIGSRLQEIHLRRYCRAEISVRSFNGVRFVLAS